jgi:hypothetical protein
LVLKTGEITFSSILCKKEPESLMPHIMRYALVLAGLVSLPVYGEPEQQSEYKQADTNFYPKGDVFGANPSAIVLAPGAATNIGGSYLITTRANPPQYVYLQETHDWIEPITPPSEPVSLNIASDAMQVREPQGSVQVALPSAPADFHDVQGGMALPNGSVLRTGDNASVAVLFGGVDSVRLAPNSQAAVQMSVAGGKRDVEVDVRGGMVFSKVGQRIGEKEAYAVHTPYGNATAHGTDYVTVVYPQRVDVWVASGTVELAAPDGTKQVTVSTGHEPLKVMRNPAAPDAKTALAYSAESLTALLNFIPMANQKLKALADRTRSGAHLTATEQDYVGRVRKVTSLIRLATINAPPAPVAAPTPIEAPKPVVVSTPPVAKPAPRALPVVMTSTEAAPPAPAPISHHIKVSGFDGELAGMTGTAQKAKPVAVTPPPSKPKPMVVAPAPIKKSPYKPVVIALGPYTPPKKKLAPVVAANSDHHTYLRAKPVDPAELAVAPSIKSMPPAKAHAVAASDPNSLGAPLTPVGAYPPLNPRRPELNLRDDTGPTGVVPTSVIPKPGVDTVP